MISKLDQELIIRQLGLENLDVKNDVYNFRCHICGDSKKSSSKKRGYFYWDKVNQQYKYKCHNCGVSYFFKFYLKKYHPEIYNKNIMLFIEKNKKTETLTEKKNDKFQKVIDKNVKKYLNYIANKKLFYNISDIDDEEVIEYIANRQLPDNSLHKIFYTENFMEILYKPIKKIMGNEIGGSFIEKDRRIFWFIKNRENEIIGLQGRSIEKNNEIRYLTVKILDDVMIGNLEDIDIKKEVFITEGFIDSLFVDNCVSLNGSNFKPSIDKLIKLGVKNVCIIFDNEPYNEQINKKVKMVIEESIKNKNINIGVCLLPKDLRMKGKDINDYVKVGMKKNQIINIIKENTFYGIEAKIRFIRW